MKAAAVGAAGLTLGSSVVGSGSAAGIPIPPLTRCGNELRDPTGQTVKLRGTNIADPGRQTRDWRGMDRWAMETVQLALDGSASPPSGTWAAEQGAEGWHNDIIRIPTQPQDILTGPDQGGTWDPWTLTPHGDDWGPILPGDAGAADPMTEDVLDTYFTEAVDPLVDEAENAGAYVMIDYHRHMPIFHQVQLDWANLDYNCGDAVDTSTTFEHDNGGCGERGVLWHGADQAEEAVNLAPDQVKNHEDVDEIFTEQEVAEGLKEELNLYWNYVADKYADRDHVVFDIYNEPTGPYNGDWGAPLREPISGGDENVDADPRESPEFWDMWVDRAQEWVDIVNETAPGSVATIGSPRWSQYTYHAGTTSEFSADALQMCYTAHIYMQDFNIPDQYGPPSQEVPVFFSEFGWAEGGGMDEFGFLAGTAPSAAERFETFIEDYPVHPLGWCFDSTWEPFFFTHEDLNEGQSNGPWMESLEPYERRPGQWWMDYAYRHRDDMKPAEGSGTPECPDDPGGTTTTTTTTTTDPGDNGDGTPGMVGDNTAYPSDPDGDGLYEDVNGNERQDIADAVDLFQNRESVDAQYFDFNDANGVSIGDAVSLFRENT